MADLAALRDIESRDPDGRAVCPTGEDCRVHEEWAVAVYGPDVWVAYIRGGWDGREVF
jgi:hypothetical protein